MKLMNDRVQLDISLAITFSLQDRQGIFLLSCALGELIALIIKMRMLELKPTFLNYGCYFCHEWGGTSCDYGSRQLLFI